jgi:hypothetical protein
MLTKRNRHYHRRLGPTAVTWVLLGNHHGSLHCRHDYWSNYWGAVADSVSWRWVSGSTVLTEEIRRREHGSQRATSPNPVKRILAINKQITPKISNFAAVSRLSHALAQRVG